MHDGRRRVNDNRPESVADATATGRPGRATHGAPQETHETERRPRVARTGLVQRSTAKVTTVWKDETVGRSVFSKGVGLHIKCLFVSKSVSARVTHSARAISEYRESGTERESEGQGRGSAGREAGPAARGLSLWLIIAKDTLEQPIHAPC